MLPVDQASLGQLADQLPRVVLQLFSLVLKIQYSIEDGESWFTTVHAPHDPHLFIVKTLIIHLSHLDFLDERCYFKTCAEVEV